MNFTNLFVCDAVLADFLPGFVHDHEVAELIHQQVADDMAWICVGGLTTVFSEECATTQNVVLMSSEQYEVFTGSARRRHKGYKTPSISVFCQV